MFKFYTTKQLVLPMLQKDSSKKMFATDAPGGKRFCKKQNKMVDSIVKNFFLVDSYKQLYTAITKEQYSFYESYEPNVLCKLYIDIDCSRAENPQYTDEGLLNDVLKLINDKLFEDYELNNLEIIVLTASTDAKISYHIIYSNIHFKEANVISYFLEEIQSDLVTNKIIDPRIYNSAGLFRIMYCNKMGKNNALKFYKSFNYNHVSDEQLFYDSLICNVDENKSTLIDYEIIEKVKPKKKVVIKRNNNDNVEVVEEEEQQPIIKELTGDYVEQLVMMLKDKYASEFKYWVKIGIYYH